ncbi:MAG: type II toxin-antitoxin system HicB family antitoxin [Candidatus Margulisbacteria bacterium]|jgi:predicted RNase H-like HicB family nuclease|nr:type II toxin-antitoxin system HicB family antitoxin [Candidatus Margulisiibacteriota bacterium]
MDKSGIDTNLTALFFREDEDTIIAACPTLDISTCGKTLEEARKNFTELVELFFEEATNMGTLDQVLADCGWKKYNNKYFEPQLIATETERVKISA